MNTTPETEWGDVKEWELKLASLLQDAGVSPHQPKIEKEIWDLFRTALTSRGTYWKEQLQKAREDAKLSVLAEIVKYTDSTVRLNKIAKEGIYALTHSELEQDITRTTWNPDIEGMKRVGKEWNELDKEITSTTKEG